MKDGEKVLLGRLMLISPYLQTCWLVSVLRVSPAPLSLSTTVSPSFSLVPHLSLQNLCSQELMPKSTDYNENKLY